MNNNIKQQILDEIQNNSSIFKKVSSVQYRIRCPICGDSKSNSRDSHCYIKCDFNNPNEPLLFNCFKCNKGGIINSNFLSKLNIKSELFKNIDNQRFNKIGYIKSMDINLITGSPIMDSPQVRYIINRLGPGFTFNDYDKFKIVWNLDSIYPYISNKRIRNTMPSNHDSITFLSDDKSTIITRSFSDEERWRKLTFINSDNKSFYVIKTTIDLFSNDDIIINIAEGPLDVISIYKNFNDGSNSVYIATLGSDYISGIEYCILKGFIGKNIIIKIYIDSDIKENLLKNRLRKFKWLFKNIYMYKNIKSKDVGVNIKDIELIEQRI